MVAIAKTVPVHSDDGQHQFIAAPIAGYFLGRGRLGIDSGHATEDGDVIALLVRVEVEVKVFYSVMLLATRSE